MKIMKSKGVYSGKVYESREYNFIFQLLIRGFAAYMIARALGRTEREIRLCWRRICMNASAYSNMRVYKLKPFSNKPFSMVNGYAKQFIRSQMFLVKQKSTARKIATQTGIPINKIKLEIMISESKMKQVKGLG